MIEFTELGLIALVLIVTGASLLAGVALGYYTASTDLKEEKRKAWREGYIAADGASNPYDEKEKKQ